MNVLNKAVKIMTCMKSWLLSIQLFKHRWQNEKYTKCTALMHSKVWLLSESKTYTKWSFGRHFLENKQSQPFTLRKTTDSTCCQLQSSSFQVSFGKLMSTSSNYRPQEYSCSWTSWVYYSCRGKRHALGSLGHQREGAEDLLQDWGFSWMLWERV